MKYPCLACGAISDRPRCPAHRPTGRQWSAGRHRGTQAKFRTAVLARAGYRCEYVADGARCTVTGASNLIAHHVTGLAAGGSSDATNGWALCREHHKAVDRNAR